MKPFIRNVAFIFILVGLFSCSKESADPPINDLVDLDGKLINDSSVNYPASRLLSFSKPSPLPADLAKPVIIAVHGFSGTTFEWKEFKAWSDLKAGNMLVSLVLLGGHGRDYSDFKKANWSDWQRPIIEEYERLRSLGYTHINLAGSSTGCPLILEMVAANKINRSTLNRIFLIDPIIVSSNKTLSLVPVLGGTVVNYTETKLDPAENGFWYKYRPAHALSELNALILKERKALEAGILLPPNVRVRVYKSEKDESADPVSAVMIQRGIKGCEVVMLPSSLHVVTRLEGRISYTDADKNVQLKIFNEMYEAIQ